MAAGNVVFQALKLMLSNGSKASEKIKAWRGKLVASEKKELREFVRFLDERRVFYVAYNGEVVECCISSLDSMKERTENALSKLEHPGARAAVGAMLDEVRAFLDEWYRFRTPSPMSRPYLPRDLHDDRGDARLAAFFQDLGGLRATVRSMLEMLRIFDSGLSAPNIEGAA